MSLEQTLTSLIKLRTLPEDKAGNRKVLNAIKHELKGLPLHFTDHVSLEYPSLVITTQQTRAPKMWLQAHIDVVPGSLEMFRPKMKNGKLYGRGAYDMKFAVACYIELLSNLGANAKDYNFGVMLTADEEVGGYNGVKYLLDEGYTSEACFLPDAGLDWSLEEHAKGLMHLKVISRGISSHAAHPWDGENAAHTMNEFLADLIGNFKKGNASKAAHKTTCNITGISTGAESSAVNQIPDYLEALVDIRPVTRKERVKVDKLLEKLSAKHPNIEIDVLSEADPYKIVIKNGYVKAWNEIAKKHQRFRKDNVRSYGSSDARFFAQKGITTVATRPKGGGLHSEEEWIDMSDLNIFYQALEEYVKRTTPV